MCRSRRTFGGKRGKQMTKNEQGQKALTVSDERKKGLKRNGRSQEGNKKEIKSKEEKMAACWGG